MNIIRKAPTRSSPGARTTVPPPSSSAPSRQGLVGVGIACLTGLTGAPEWVQFAIVPTVMAVLAPIQAEIGKTNE